jgi:hypothetical protein
MSLSQTTQSPSLVPSIARQDRSLVRRMLSAILSQWPERVRGSPLPPSYLRRDLGLMPDEPSKRHWDHQ